MKLDLSDNPMTAEMADELAETVRQQPNIRTLILNDMSLTDEGVGCILAALQQSAPDLETLELALNEITPEGAKVNRDLIHPFLKTGFYARTVLIFI